MHSTNPVETGMCFPSEHFKMSHNNCAQNSTSTSKTHVFKCLKSEHNNTVCCMTKFNNPRVTVNSKDGMFSFACRIWHVHLHPEVQPLLERKGSLIQTSGFRLHESKKRVSPFSKGIVQPKMRTLHWIGCLFCCQRPDGVMRTMNTEKLLKTIPIIQNQMDALLDFNVSLWSQQLDLFKLI